MRKETVDSSHLTWEEVDGYKIHLESKNDRFWWWLHKGERGVHCQGFYL